MATSNLTIRLDDELRHRTTLIFSNYGLSPSQAIKLFLNQVARTGSIPLSFDYDKTVAYESNPVTMAAIEDARAGRVTRFSSIDEMMDTLSK